MYTCLTLRRGLSALAVATLMALALPGAALAQTPGSNDLRALIYYLDHNDQRSVQAEMRRLRAQFPGWTPPTDLNALRNQAQPEAVDVAPIWARIERGDNAGARTLIDRTRAASPGWSPDAEMLRVLDLNEGQAAFDAAHAAGDPAAAIATARRVPAIMRCDRINNAWRLADMYRAAGQRDAALETYRGIAGTCTRQSDAVATLEKANEIGSGPEMEQLFAAARRAGPANARALDEAWSRLRGGRGQAAPAAATTPRRTGTDAAVAAAPSVARPPPVQGATATGVGSGPLPVRGDPRTDEIRRLKEAGQFAQCLARSNDPRSVDVLYERSWCAFSMNRAGEALNGFTATERTGTALGAEVHRDARFGMILAYLSMNMTEAGAGLAAATNLTGRQRLEVETTILDQRGVRSFQRREFDRAINYFDALEQLAGALRRDLAMMRGYAYMNTGRDAEALDQFTRLHAQLATDDTRVALRALSARLGG